MHIAYTTNGTLLKTEGVSLSLNGNPIITDLNVEIENIHRDDCQQGQVVAILGPSGNGKTQTFRMLSGLQEPTAGRILVGSPLAPVRNGIVGVVSQAYPLFDHYTVLGNLIVGAKQSGMKKAEATEKALTYLESFGLKDKATLFPSQLSGGQKQRVAIAQQLLCSEHYLILDEPFSGLDVLMKKKTQDILLDISKRNENNTIIFSTHDVKSSVIIADKIWLLGKTYDESGKFLGSTVKTVYDLAAMGLAWQPGIERNPECIELVRRIEEEDFPKLI